MDRKDKRAKRKQILQELIDQIMNGELDTSKPLPDQIYSIFKTPREQLLFRQQTDMKEDVSPSPTKQYISPTERSNYNYGYMTSYELGAGDPNVNN